jgi:long-subunit acyl-CoA synthetase (AMP-forming)
MTQKTTDEIRTILNNAKLDFVSVENKALNDYLPKIFHSCPFTEEICTTKQCVDCAVFTNYANKQKL